MVMNNLADMSVKELCELAKENRLQIEIQAEPDHYGGSRVTFTIQPWEKYEPYCPHGMPIVHVREKRND